MAARYFGIVPGYSLKEKVTSSATTTSAVFEFVITDVSAANVDKLSVRNALRAIEEKIDGGTWPPS